LVAMVTAKAATAEACLSSGSAALKLERVVDLEGVSPLFKVPAWGLVAQKVAPGALRQAQGERG